MNDTSDTTDTDHATDATDSTTADSTTNDSTTSNDTTNAGERFTAAVDQALARAKSSGMPPMTERELATDGGGVVVNP